jgi:hypothetical protein
MANRKEQVQPLANRLALANSQEADEIRKLVGLMIEDAKDKMVEATGEEVIRCQGEARALQGLLKKLTRAPAPPAPPKGSVT